MNIKRNIRIAFGLLATFVLWTAALRLVDVQPIGPHESNVGFAKMNLLFHQLTGVHMTLYTITDWLGLLPLFLALAFAVLGLMQWIKRKHILKVDGSILALGVFYLIVMAAYLFFECCVVNYRPVLIEGILEASYPSSTTMLAMCVMPTALMQLKKRFSNRTLRRTAGWVIWSLTVFMVAGRLVSGVHWLSDIIGGILFSSGLVLLYASVCKASFPR